MRNPLKITPCGPKKQRFGRKLIRKPLKRNLGIRIVAHFIVSVRNLSQGLISFVSCLTILCTFANKEINYNICLCYGSNLSSVIAILGLISQWDW